MSHTLAHKGRRKDSEDGTPVFSAAMLDQLLDGQDRAPVPRFVGGLRYFKHTFALSDEEQIARWVENSYWQYSCGEAYFQHEPPIHPTSLIRYRQRLGPGGCEELLQVTIEAGVAGKIIEARDMAEELIDTTVTEKAFSYLTDSKLYLESRRV